MLLGVCGEGPSRIRRVVGLGLGLVFMLTYILYILILTILYDNSLKYINRF